MSLPHPIHIAAAFAVVHQKPAHLSVQEYIRSLRHSVREQHIAGQSCRTIDHSIFWQGQYDTLSSALDSERNAAFLLSQRNEALEAQIAHLQTRSTPNPRKRKATAYPDQAPTKMARSDSIVVAEFGPAAEMEPATKAMRHIHRIEKLCRGQMYGTEAKTLAQHLVLATDSLARIVESLLVQDPAARSDKAIIALARSFTVILHGMKRLGDLPDDSQSMSNVVFACIDFFDTLFTTIEEAASSMAKSGQCVERWPILPALGQLASSVMLRIRDTASRPRSFTDILEGATYHLLHRLGETAHELFLGGPRLEDIEDAITHLPLPEDKRLDPAKQIILQASLISAPHFLAILRRTVNSNADMVLVQKARAKLQRTLVDCIFGPDSRMPNASDDVLRPPMTPDSLPPFEEPTATTENLQEKTDWFESELWTVIGWDILGNDCESTDS